MTNFIYIFMIIKLICIGAGIKAFNSEDSDTKTTIKNIPNGIKKVLLIGTNVQKTDITILIGTIIYLMFTIGVICIYVFASHETKVELQYKLCVAFLVMLFLETFIVVSVSYREKKTQNKAMNIHETIYMSHAEKEIECDMFSKYIILSNKRWKDAKGTVYIFPATLFHEMDADGNIFRETEKGIEYLSNIGAYKSLAEQLVDEGYQTVRFETKNIADRSMSLEELLNKLVDVINNIQSVTGKYPIYLIGHNSTCNILLLLQKKIKTQGMILLFGGGETGKQRIIFRCRLDRFGRIKRVRQREVEREYEKAESLIKENNVVMAYGELFNMESEFWISILAEIEKPILCISAEADWNYNGEEIAQHVQNENVKFKILPDVDATMRLGFRNHLAANNLTYMGYLNRKGVTKPEDGKDIPCYAEDIGKCIMEYMEHLQ